LKTNTDSILLVLPNGITRFVYGEVLDLQSLGPASIVRASHVEPDEAGQWWADLSPVKGPRLGPFGLRSEALALEMRWLQQHWLQQPAAE
jgi:hypothetical protein